MNFRIPNWSAACIAALLSLHAAIAFAQAPPPPSNDAVLEGTVRDLSSAPIPGVSVILRLDQSAKQFATTTDAQGRFAFPSLAAGTYVLLAQKSGLREVTESPVAVAAGQAKHLELVLGPTSPAQNASHAAPSLPEQMQFDEQADFRVEGITDATAAGGHGSDANLRTSEALAKDARRLEDQNPGEHAPGGQGVNESEASLRAAVARTPASFEANHDLGEFYFRSHRYREAIPLLEGAHGINPQDYSNAYDLALAYKLTGDVGKARSEVLSILTDGERAELHLLLGDIDEQTNDPVSAVREYERATQLKPQEQNYFAWATELLLHGAIQPATEIFTKGVSAYPASERMLAGLGAALYAGGSYQEAALRLCAASDLNPTDPSPYLFLEKMDQAAPAPLDCVAERLARFAHDQPDDAKANYFYAMALLKRSRSSSNSATTSQILSLLKQAVRADGKLAEAYLQLGIVYSEGDDLNQAVDAYRKSIAADPGLAEAHFRLGRAYQKLGEPFEANMEFQAHERLRKLEATAVEQQRRELGRFLIVMKNQSESSPVR